MKRFFLLIFAAGALAAVAAIPLGTTGFPGLNYLAFGFVSLPVGVVNFIAGLLCYSRARTARCATGDAVAAMFISVGIAVVPLAALFEFADYS